MENFNELAHAAAHALANVIKAADKGETATHWTVDGQAANFDHGRAIVRAWRVALIDEARRACHMAADVAGPAGYYEVSNYCLHVLAAAKAADASPAASLSDLANTAQSLAVALARATACNALKDAPGRLAWEACLTVAAAITADRAPLGTCSHCQERPSRLATLARDEGGHLCHQCETALYNPDPNA